MYLFAYLRISTKSTHPLQSTELYSTVSIFQKIFKSCFIHSNVQIRPLFPTGLLLAWLLINSGTRQPEATEGLNPARDQAHSYNIFNLLHKLLLTVQKMIDNFFRSQHALKVDRKVCAVSFPLADFKETLRLLELTNTSSFKRDCYSRLTLVSAPR